MEPAVQNTLNQSSPNLYKDQISVYKVKKEMKSKNEARWRYKKQTPDLWINFNFNASFGGAQFKF